MYSSEIVLGSPSGRYFITAEVSMDMEFDFMTLEVDGTIYDNDVWLVEQLRPALAKACKLGVSDDVIKEYDIPDEDFCEVHELFELAAGYGLYREYKLEFCSN